MYHLTCPSCQDVTDSPFVRSGAVVRCSACENKYRIKSAHFVREVESGPRTLDESDSILRSDSVDIDPDEVAPVSIDDDGNVVGLSGLSELMRFSDTQAQSDVEPEIQKAKAKRKSKEQTEDALPQAKAVGKKTKSEQKANTKDAPPRSGRERAQALKRKKRNKTIVAAGGVGVVVLIIAIILAVSLSSELQTIEDATTEDPPKKPDTPTTALDPPAPTNPDKPRQNPGTNTNPDTPDPDGPDEVLIFSEDYKPSPNPRITFVPPWVEADTSMPPSDVPTVLTPAKPLTHEGWYVMTPPRGAADATGVGNVELGQITASALDDSLTLLAGDVANNTDRAVMNGELHIMLLDSTGNVFAETYTPLAMIEPRSKQAIAMTIPSRYWRRSRGVRAGVQVMDWANEIKPVEGVQLAPAGTGQAAALRVSLKHQGDRPLRSLTLMVSATDPQGNAVARFLIEEENLYIPKDRWLDLVIATPLPDGRAPAKWSAILLQQ